MDHKQFKQDLTYTCKRFAKENKSLCVDSGLLAVDNEGKLAAQEELGVLDAFCLVKGYTPTAEMLTVTHDKWEYPEGVWHESKWAYHEAFGVSTIQIIIEQAKISRNDLYAFLDGLENVEWLGTKNEFYEVGVYIREKFSPVGARTEPLRTKFLERFPKGDTFMKGYVVYTRQVPCSACRKTDAPTIIEVEYQKITAMEDPSVNFMPAGEFKARIFQPEFLWEPKEGTKSDGSKEKTMVPPVYHSHSVHETLEDARRKAFELVESGFKFELRKRGTEYTQEEVQAKMVDVQELSLADAKT